MGLLDRLKGRKADDDGGAVVEPPIDRPARRTQLDELENALRLLARAMSDPERLNNPGWRGRIDDYRFAANEASHLSHTEFQRADVLDLLNQIRPLYTPGASAPPAEYLVFEAEQDAVMTAVQHLRSPLPSETASGDGPASS